jgi:hypothetical protein
MDHDADAHLASIDQCIHDLREQSKEIARRLHLLAFDLRSLSQEWDMVLSRPTEGLEEQADEHRASS